MTQWIHKAVFVPATLADAEIAVLRCFATTARATGRAEIAFNALTHRRVAMAALAVLIVRQFMEPDVARKVYVLTPLGHKFMQMVSTLETT